MFFKLVACSCATVLLASQTSDAEIVLTIDVSDQTWELSGADTGNPQKVKSNSEVEWETSGVGAAYSFDMTQTPATTNTEWTPTINTFVIETNQNSFHRINFFLQQSGDVSSSTVTVTPIGGAFSYAGLSPSAETWFEGLIGNTIPVNRGTNFSPITVQGVPEPTSLALFGIAMLGLSRQWRFRRG